MTLIRFEPLRELESWNERIHQMFGDYNTQELSSFNPKIDICEDEKNIFVEAEVPGVKKEDIKITLEDNILTISGEKRSGKKDEDTGRNYYRSERTYGSFTRSFTLPEEINSETVDAKIIDGILKVTIQKMNKKPVNERFIDIK